MSSDTYKVLLDSQSLGAVLLQKSLEQLTPSVGHVRLQHQRLVQDVVVHLGRVATVERRLKRERNRQSERCSRLHVNYM